MSIASEIQQLEEKAKRHPGASFTSLINGDKIEISSSTNGLFNSFSYKKNGKAIDRDELMS